MVRRDSLRSCGAAELRRLRAERRLSLRELAARVHHGKSYIHELESGRKPPSLEVARRLDAALDGRGRLFETLTEPHRTAGSGDDESELDALELARRVAATDVGSETIDRLERAVDTLAMAYATTLPQDLLPGVRRHLRYVARLVPARKTLDQHRSLLVVGGWLALLRATLHIDLQQPGPAQAHLDTAGELARHAGHAEISAWCLETRAWQVLTALESSGGEVTRPRRTASARLDLALALLTTNRPDEAAAVATTALDSGRIVASNWWRATEVVAAVARSGVAEGAELRELYETRRPGVLPA